MTSDLVDFVASMGGERSLRVEENFGDGFVKLRVSEAERRQAKHDIRCIEDVVVEMLRNSRDAGARRIFVATFRDGSTRKLTILDDGSGVPESMQDRIFDARVTSKLESVHMDRWGVHGRGMALFSVKENAESARVVDSAPGKGSSIKVVTDVEKVRERADQSTWPSLGSDDDGNQSVVRGPHNIIRTCCEFALEERGRCEVYVGSPAEIAATARRRVKPSLGGSDLLFVDTLSELPVLERFAVAADASELFEVSRGLGLDMSERTAHRIVSGQVKPLRSVFSRLTHKGSPDPKEVDLQKDRRGLKVSVEDLENFSRVMERDFSSIADKYYLCLAADPKIRVTRNKITVTFEIDEGD
ncbi:ATP-binding protein [Parafannyhessea umbonata]|uniref:Histidine kinase-, DNA gyrase B-, and HSP90-like ATPase n=1 Tax=Parafannyhessea umbonata TaxID=604330 RepID=A0A1H9QJX4_9ACTN|nr:ATP-binding protein [Parafannyhessea umbonata]SER60073.1 Histidine kinase-, DNA gyrase B-, and HSP90-like ATPase [Parafannyhessea umbonata]